jgi:hypothetical protein
MADKFCHHLVSSTPNEGFFYTPPSQARHAEEFLALKNLTASAGFERTILGTRGQHADHYTTKAAHVDGT